MKIIYLTIKIVQINNLIKQKQYGLHASIGKKAGFVCNKTSIYAYLAKISSISGDNSISNPGNLLQLILHLTSAENFTISVNNLKFKKWNLN